MCIRDSLITVSAYETIMGFSFLTKVFSALERYRLKVDAVNTTEASVTIALSNSERLHDLSNDLIEVGSVEIEAEKGLITLIGCSPSRVDELTKYVFNALGSSYIHMLNFSEKKRLLNIVLDDSLTQKMSQSIHSSVFC